MSTTDPDATHLPCRDGTRLGYQGHYLVDGGKARIILGALATPGEVPEERPALDLIWQARARWRRRPRQATADKAYGTIPIIRALEEQGVRAYVLFADRPHADRAFSKDAFRYDPVADAYTCPAGATLPYNRSNRAQQLLIYQAPAAACDGCPLRARCTPSPGGRQVSRQYDEAFLDRVRAYQRTEAYHKARHGLRRCRLRRLWRVNVQVTWTATGQNLKRLLAGRGWGRRPFPAAPGLHLAPIAALPTAC